MPGNMYYQIMDLSKGEFTPCAFLRVLAPTRIPRVLPSLSFGFRISVQGDWQAWLSQRSHFWSVVKLS